MGDLTDAEWDEFHALVDATGPLIKNKPEIVFRGGGNTISLDYINAPFEDAKKMAMRLDEDSNYLEDTGFHTILPLAKCVEMYLRIIFLGDNITSFQNEGFHFSRCQRAIRKWLKEGRVNDISFNGFNNIEVKTSGNYWNKIESYCKTEVGQESLRKLMNRASEIYRIGNPFRHNQIMEWSKAKKIFRTQEKNLNKVIRIFAEIKVID